MTPDQEARKASEAWWAGHMNSFPGFAPTGAPAQTPRYVYEAFEAGYQAGRAAGMAESAEIAEQVAEDYPTDIFTPLERNEKNATTDRISASMARHTSRRIAQAIRAAAEGK